MKLLYAKKKTLIGTIDVLTAKYLTEQSPDRIVNLMQQLIL